MNADASATHAENLSVMSKKDTFLGHPKGLAFIVFTEAWERFSFYGMQALLVLYMAGYLLTPEHIHNVSGIGAYRAMVEGVFGPLSTQALATQTFGLYIGLIYFMPVFGGLAGDRITGQRRAVLLGAVLMAVGHFMMAFESAFLYALLMLIIGAGLLKGNLAAQVGRLYAKTDQRRDSAYSIYVMAINVGAFVAPLVCGTLGELYGWHYGFGAAGIGMLIGTAIYIAGRGYLPPDETVAERIQKPGLQSGDGMIIAALVVLLVIGSLYWTAQSQVWNAYPLWVRDQVDRSLFGLTVPVTWFQSLDSLAVLVLAPFVLWYWRWQSVRQAEHSDLTKIVIGCAVFTLACIWLSVGELLSGGAKVALLWPVLFHFICAIGFLYVGPIMLALVSKAAPEAVNAMMVGSYYLSIFVGGVFSGWLGRFYEVLPPAWFWLLHGAIVGAGSVFIIVLRRPLIRILKLRPTTQSVA